MDPIEITIVDPKSPIGEQLLRDYILEVAGRYYERQPTTREMAEALADRDQDKLGEPDGLLVVATAGKTTLGCGGVRWIAGGIGELTRVFVRQSARGGGIGAAIVQEIERLARERGVSTLRLDTRTDLIEARRLYARLGFSEVLAYNDDPYAQHWMEKTLSLR